MKRHAPYVLIGLLFCAMQTFGWMAPIDNALQDLRNKVEGRPATGEVILVDIDTRSLRAIDVWPWPRSIHGALVDRLVADGAARIGACDQHKIRVQLIAGIGGGTIFANRFIHRNHLPAGDVTAALRDDLVFDMNAGGAGLDVFTHGADDIDGVAVTIV